ncbi:MAG TPA: tRNA (N6-isopentenyl adenosine(37)-C2)-methylthiotransferase MiaB [Candidatus Hydrogenedens sp.]|nr:tRNA (N6-isopentenyl adenosine(37)-C2)-methylthiotransferase MiaB [Candidatus Hydrogenedens sp.]HOL19123.1 tRNA (N6-isopentenyl adenosine(37)-C2)-methylthiotransferase MiaB [Candidatus Hydrogenedens sp.]HPP58059.1 tRNA (N6-isopentenyl adenosine(37)-C2)-methylthiotransferase MiaB [Candidatus Hydrogenedens sp.]
MNKQKVFIKTFGCQMNEHDSARIVAILEQMGYLLTDQPDDANMILINTCSVRENPENKVYSLLGALRPIKERNPKTIIGVCGCVAQQEGEHILKRESVVDIVIGPDHYFELPELISRVREGERICCTYREYPKPPIFDFIPSEWLEKGHREGVKAYIVISKGCNNACSFCIVPRTRGREVYRTPESILKEVRSAVSEGIREIWLLGQNVNTYKYTSNYRFIELLNDVAKEHDLWRIRFTSPHPYDWSKELTDLIAERPNIARHIHLPLQSGSNRILKLMRRRHTIDDYLEQVDYIKKKVPGIEISTDLIVGFPTETEIEFEETMEVVRRVQFSQIYPFKYSPRPKTYAEKLGDTVPREEKEERLARLIALQEEINQLSMSKLIGTQQEVLIEDRHPRNPSFWNGRTNSYRSITVCGENMELGDLVSARVVGYHGHWLEAEYLDTLKKSSLINIKR